MVGEAYRNGGTESDYWGLWFYFYEEHDNNYSFIMINIRDGSTLTIEKRKTSKRNVENLITGNKRTKKVDSDKLNKAIEYFKFNYRIINFVFSDSF